MRPLSRGTIKAPRRKLGIDNPIDQRRAPVDHRGAAFHVQLGENPAEISGYRPFADGQLVGNVLCCVTLRHQHGDLELTPSETRREIVSRDRIELSMVRNLVNDEMVSFGLKSADFRARCLHRQFTLPINGETILTEQDKSDFPLIPAGGLG